ncbi:MAG: hypothetical protein DRR08_13490 [Candidatus Parabeggiatoa sp. nov. 2]|nr:MAG: hypothetical protein B6247_06170 [Beggiatoa sp. 4572_84]RKZ59604.1 MAG: hypothetical protein DRR08_13490 [Gammaproteobacteria bacterium]HEC84967.1 hypothetical protein [Thioploca sp.]
MRLFSPRRYLQKRNEIVTPQSRKGRREWVISRSLCYYRLFSLTDIPAARRDSVLQLQIKQWSPFQDYASYIVWQGGQAQVWIWDKQQQQNLLTETGIKKATCLPESLLRTRCTKDTIQLLQCLEGFEGQIWIDGLLIGSRWWAQIPNETQWANFQRAHSLPASTEEPSPIEEALLKRPWGRSKKHFSRFKLFHERIWVTLGAAIFIVVLTWQTVSIWKWQQATEQLQTQIDELNENVAPILAARNQAFADKKQSEQILALAPYPSQLELMTQVAEKLPRRNTKLIEWFYQIGELRFTIETRRLDPTFYVKTFQALPLFRDVKAETGRKSNQIIISMQLTIQMKNEK